MCLDTPGAPGGLQVMVGIVGAQTLGLGDGEQAVVGREKGQGRGSYSGEVRLRPRSADASCTAS